MVALLSEIIISFFSSTGGVLDWPEKVTVLVTEVFSPTAPITYAR